MCGMVHRIASALVIAALAPTGILIAQIAQVRAEVAPSVPHYQPGPQVKGDLKVPCTDALEDINGEWVQGFQKFQPGINVEFVPTPVDGAVKAFLGGQAPLVILDRILASDEMDEFRTKRGYMPMRIPVCLDAIVVFVNKANPITSITLQQLDAIYSRDRQGGAPAPALVWGDLGVTGELAQRTIDAYVRPDGNATRTTFAAKAMLKGRFRSGLFVRDDDSSLAQAVTNDAAGIGFGPMAAWYATNKTLPVVPYHDSDARYPTQSMVTTSKYPMPGIFYAYLDWAPGTQVPAPINELLHYLLAQEGQNVIADLGLLPGPPEFMAIAWKRLNQ